MTVSAPIEVALSAVPTTGGIAPVGVEGEVAFAGMLAAVALANPASPATPSAVPAKPPATPAPPGPLDPTLSGGVDATGPPSALAIPTEEGATTDETIGKEENGTADARSTIPAPITLAAAAFAFAIVRPMEPASSLAPARSSDIAYAAPVGPESAAALESAATPLPAKGILVAPAALGPVRVGGGDDASPNAETNTAAPLTMNVATATEPESGSETGGGSSPDGRSATPLPDRPAGIRETGRADAPLAPLTSRERAEVVLQVTRQIERLDITSIRRPLEIRMEPAELGQVTVTLAKASGGVVADFSASDPRVAVALDRHRGELAGALVNRGFESARVTVTNVAPAGGLSDSNANSFTGGRGGSQPPRPDPAWVATPPRSVLQSEPAVAAVSRRPRLGSHLDIAI